MKILINLGRFNGGAPLSILEYAKIAKNNGHDVIAVGEYKVVEAKYIEENIKTYDLPFFSSHKILTNIRSFSLLAQIIKDEKPDLIHATSYGIVPSKYFGLFYGIPVIYSIAGGQITGKTHFKGDQLIAYSQENKNALLKEGYEENQIQVISNRLSFYNLDNSDLNIYNSSEQIKLLLITRLDLGVINSVISIIDLADELAHEYDKLTLDIIGDGEFRNKISQSAVKVNKKHNRCIVKVHGYIDKPQKFIKESHIVFGKGRSIIEAVLNHRIAFIIGEDKKISLCTLDTLDNLYEYNFSGRNISENYPISKIREIIFDLKNGKYNKQKIMEISKKVDELYNIKYAEDKIVKLYENCNSKLLNTVKHNKISSVLFLFKYYIFEAINIKKWRVKLKKLLLKV